LKSVRKRGYPENYCKMYQDVWGLKICILKYLNVYGPRQKPHPVQKFIPTFIDRALKGKPIPIWGTGKQTVDPIYVEDVVEATVRSWELGCWGETVEIGLGKPVPVIDVANMILELTGSDSKIEFLPMRSGEPLNPKYKLYADTRLMEKLLGLRPEDMTQLPDGIKKTLEWWRK